MKSPSGDSVQAVVTSQELQLLSQKSVLVEAMMLPGCPYPMSQHSMALSPGKHGLLIPWFASSTLHGCYPTSLAYTAVRNVSTQLSKMPCTQGQASVQ